MPAGGEHPGETATFIYQTGFDQYTSVIHHLQRSVTHLYILSQWLLLPFPVPISASNVGILWQKMRNVMLQMGPHQLVTSIVPIETFIK